MEVTYGVRYLPLLQRWVVKNLKQRGRGIDPQNSNIESTGSISLGGVKLLAESMVVTYGVRYIPLLKRLVVENPKMSEAGGLTPKI
jgi:hypothetical protein